MKVRRRKADDLGRPEQDKERLNTHVYVWIGKSTHVCIHGQDKVYTYVYLDKAQGGLFGILRAGQGVNVYTCVHVVRFRDVNTRL